MRLLVRSPWPRRAQSCPAVGDPAAALTCSRCPQAIKEARRDLQTKVADMLNNDEPRESLISQTKELTSKLQLADAEVIGIVSVATPGLGSAPGVQHV